MALVVAGRAPTDKGQVPGKGLAALLLLLLIPMRLVPSSCTVRGGERWVRSLAKEGV